MLEALDTLGLSVEVDKLEKSQIYVLEALHTFFSVYIQQTKQTLHREAYTDDLFNLLIML